MKYYQCLFGCLCVSLIFVLVVKLAQKAGITKYVAPYIIKPSSITLDFNKQVNPKIIQRKARHRKIETTLRYDHVSDDMVRAYFERTLSEQKPTEISFENEEKKDHGFGYV